MRYVYIDNFRGFSDTLLPLRQITFLVGENSTGKSSFLKILRLLSSPQFWFVPEHSLHDDPAFGNFEDMVSAWSSDRTYFKVGALSVPKSDRGRITSCVFAVCVFENQDGTPSLKRYVQYADDQLSVMAFDGNNSKYRITVPGRPLRDENEVVEFFREVVRGDADDVKGLKMFPKGIPTDLPLAVAVSALRHMAEDSDGAPFALSGKVPFGMDTVWIAPIRTKPQRVYDGTKRRFTPEGDHTPYLLSVEAKSKTFVKKLSAFGTASGLFQTIRAHSFGKADKSPFEIIVRFTGAKLSINNVGYGVSQVLPLVVEFLSRPKNSAFAVQQPEVHLHPRAQAALGDLVAELAKEREHDFLLETHSEYLINRCRLNVAQQKDPPEAQVLFFYRGKGGNKAAVIPISPHGRYSVGQPPEFRDFFIKEEMDLLEL